MVVARGSLAASQGDQMRFPPLIQFGWLSWPGIFFQGPLQASLQVPPLGTAHRTRRCVQRLHNALYPPGRVRLQQNTGPGNLSRWVHSPANQSFQLVSFFLF